MNKGPNATPTPISLHQKTLKLAEHDLNHAHQLFSNPQGSLGLSYRDLLQTVAHYPELVQKLVKANVQDLEEPEPLLTLLDGQDLTLLGSHDKNTMLDLLERYPEKFVGADLIQIAKTYPSLVSTVFETPLRKKLSGRQLAELGSLDKEVAQAIRDDEDLWTLVTTHPDVEPMIKDLKDQLDENKLSAQEFRQKVAVLTNEEKTFMNVGVLCKNHPSLAQSLVDEGFLYRLNGEDLSYFAQFHPDIISTIFKDELLLSRLEGNDFKRLGLASEDIANTILESKELMVKSGPHVWAELSGEYDHFGGEFIQAFEMAVQQYLNKKAQFDKNPTSSEPKPSELMRFTAEFLIVLAERKGPKFAEYLYDQTVNKKNPVYRHVFKLDDSGKVFDVDKILSKMKADFEKQGITDDSPEAVLRLALVKESLEARNKQAQDIKYNYLCALASISPVAAHSLLDDMEKFPTFQKDISGSNYKTLARDPDVIKRILETPELVKKCSGAHLALMAKVTPELFETIWSNSELRQRIIESRSVPILCNRYLSVILESAQNNGFTQDIIDAMKKSSNAKDKEIPKGYFNYLYNHLYPRAEITYAIQHLLKEALSQDETANQDELNKVDVVTPMFNSTSSAHSNENTESTSSTPLPKAKLG